MQENKFSYSQVILIIAGLYAICNYLHNIVKIFLLEPNFCDFACYYFFADLLNKGINFFRIDQQTIESLKTISNIPVHICGAREATALYSPAFYSLMSLIAKLKFNIANLIWFLINNIVLVISIIFLMKIIILKIDIINLSICSILVFLFQPLIESVGIGQANLLILGMLVLTLWSIMKEKFIIAGLFMAVAIHIKPQYGFISLLFLIKKIYRPFLSTIFFYCLISVISVLVVGWEFSIDYFPCLINSGRFTYEYERLLWTGNSSFLSTILRLLNGKYFNICKIIHSFLIIIILLYTIKLFYNKFNKEHFPLEFAWMTSLSLFLSPFLHEHYFVLLYLPIFIIYSKINYLSRLWQYIFIFGFLLTGLRYSLEQFNFFHFGLASILANGKLYGLIFILLTIFFLIKRSRFSVNIENHEF